MVAPADSDPGTPVRRRPLQKDYSDPKEPDLKKRRGAGDPEDHGAGLEVKVVKAEPGQAEPVVVAHDAEFVAHLDRHGVSAAGRARLLPLLRRWGPSRASQVLGLWTFLGDGVRRPPASPAVQVWGPAGTGKTEVVFGYVKELKIRHVRLNCACFSSIGELQARLAEELRRCAAAAAVEADDTGEVPKELQNRMPPGRQLRAVDRLEAALRPPLDRLSQTAQDAAQGASHVPAGSRLLVSDKVVCVFEHAQELPRLGPGTIELLLSLPEVLRQGGQLVLLFISRLPLSGLGAPPEREPPQVAFPPYSRAEAEALLLQLLASRAYRGGPDGEEAVIVPSDGDLRAICSSGLIKFAAPYTGVNLHDLLWIGQEVLRTPAAFGASMATLQTRIEELVQERLGLCDLRGLLDESSNSTSSEQQQLETSVIAAKAAMQCMTKAEKRLLLAAYLGARIDKDDDVQLFMPEGRRRLKRKGSVVKQHGGDDTPPFLRAPRPVTLARVLAIYHRLARQAQLLGPPLFEHLMNLREAGLLRFAGNFAATAERDPKVVCRAELPLARACAADLGVDLAEFLCTS